MKRAEGKVSPIEGGEGTEQGGGGIPNGGK